MKISQSIIYNILENPLNTSFDIRPLIHSSMKKNLPESDILPVEREITVEQAILLAKPHGYHIKPVQSLLPEL